MGVGFTDQARLSRFSVRHYDTDGGVIIHTQSTDEEARPGYVVGLSGLDVFIAAGVILGVPEEHLVEDHPELINETAGNVPTNALLDSARFALTAYVQRIRGESSPGPDDGDTIERLRRELDNALAANNDQGDRLERAERDLRMLRATLAGIARRLADAAGDDPEPVTVAPGHVPGDCPGCMPG